VGLADEVLVAGAEAVRALPRPLVSNTLSGADRR
jgi:hypothetical protein